MLTLSHHQGQHLASTGQGFLHHTPAHRPATYSESVSGAVCCPRIPSAMARWGKWGQDSPCSPFLSHYFFSHMQTWQRPCSSSAEAESCLTAAAHHRSNHAHSCYSGSVSALELSWCLLSVNTVTSSIWHLHSCCSNCTLGSKCQCYYKQD